MKITNYYDSATDIRSYLTFRLGDEIYACHVNKLLSILEIPKITEVPGAPKYMKGIIDLRGKVLPLIDTKIKLNMPAVEFTKDTCIVVMDISFENDNLLIGVLVDAVLEVLEFEGDKILPPPNLGKKYQSRFIYGIVKKDEKFIMLLDIDMLFSIDEIEHLKEATDDKAEMEESPQ
jgi:purine-binding chemotaxis protein CheW